MSSPTPTPTATEAPESLEALQQRHRKEQRDLVSRTTQKKKQATKKTRKGVNDECERLEQELKERQAEELKKLNGDGGEVEEEEEEEESEPATPSTKDDVKGQPEETTANKTTPPASQPPKPKKNRQKDRLARRQAAQDESIRQAELEALNAPNPRDLERQRFAPLLSAHQLALHEIRADGHCLYAAVADQLATRELGVAPKIDIQIAGAEKGGYKAVRYAAAAWMERNPEEFAGFMEDPLPEHVRKIRETGEWGGHLELLALARMYGVRICVLHSDGRVDRIEDEGVEGEKREIWLGYYRHSHGLGEHYNSLRRVEGQAEG